MAPTIGVGVLVIAVFIGLTFLQNQKGQRHRLRPGQNLRPERLQIVCRSGSNWGWGSQCREIYQDTETGVQYLIISTSYSTSVTPLLDSEGRPCVGRE